LLLVNMSPSAVPGVLMRLASPSADGTDRTKLAPSAPCPNIQKMYTAVADDGEKPERLALYVLSDISPLVSSSELYDTDKTANSDLNISWVVCGFINGRDKGSSPTEPPSTAHSLTHSPVPGSKIVINGSTPRPDKESDYHDWYNEEHGPGLSIVPGWNAARRYSLEKTYGDLETAHFYGFNYYDEESGLGGPIWQKSTKTEWTFRIRGNAAKPNIRRVWKIENF
jgi:hypothetical protein